MCRRYVRAPTCTGDTHGKGAAGSGGTTGRLVADRLVTMRDGRGLGLTAFGDPAVERVVVLCHPAPGAGGFDPDPAVTSAWGVHVVSVDRPGYGSSTALPDYQRPSVNAWADDLSEY